MGEYSDYPADYAEVSSFHSGQQSPAPYATTTLIGSSKMGANSERYNMFYTTDINYPSNTAAVPNQNNNNNKNSNNNNNQNYNRSLHSETYFNPNMQMNIVENRLANTMEPSMFHQHHNDGKSASNKRNRLKLIKPQNFRINFGSQGEQLYVKVGEINPPGQSSTAAAQHTPQSQNGSVNWSQQNFNIYENQLHNQMNGAMSNGPDKEYTYAGNRSIMSYMSAKDFPENI